MRIPKIYRYSDNVDTERIEIKSTHFTKPTPVFITDKEKDKFVKVVKKLCRTSYEYKEFVSYLVLNEGMDVCSFFNNVKKSVDKGIQIEIHHEPFTVEDIIQIVTAKWIAEDRRMNYFGVAEEVMSLHFQGKVGLIPLSVTVHQLVHVGKVFIPLQFLDNGFLEFFKEYKPYITDQMKSVLEQKIKLSKTSSLEDNDILRKKYIYVVNEYNSTPRLIEVRK